MARLRDGPMRGRLRGEPHRETYGVCRPQALDGPLADVRSGMSPYPTPAPSALRNTATIANAPAGGACAATARDRPHAPTGGTA